MSFIPSPFHPEVIALRTGQVDFTKFDGSDKANLKHFLKHYQIYATDFQWSIEQQIDCFPLALTGKARLWFEGDTACQAIINGTAKEQAQYDQLVELIKAQYKYIELKASFNFAKATQQPDESIDDFLKRLQYLLEIYLEPDLRSWIPLVYSKLSKPMQDHLGFKLGSKNFYTSFDDFRYDMTLVEEAERIRQKRFSEVLQSAEKHNNHNRRRHRNNR